MTQTEILPETENDSPETQDFDSLSYARKRFALDNVGQIFLASHNGDANPSIRANYKHTLTTMAQCNLPERIIVASDEEPLYLLEKDESGKSLADSYAESLAETLTDEASGRMQLYENYLYQLARSTDSPTIYDKRKKFNRDSPIHSVGNLQASVTSILAMNGVNSCSAQDLKALATEFTTQKVVEQDFQEFCWLRQLRDDLNLQKAVNTIREFDATNREQEAMATMSWLGRKVMGIVGKTRRRLGRSALADFR